MDNRDAPVTLCLHTRRDDIVATDMVADMGIDLEVHMVADMEVDKVADIVADMAVKKNMADMELDMMADMESDKVADMVAAYSKTKCIGLKLKCTWLACLLKLCEFISKWDFDTLP